MKGRNFLFILLSAVLFGTQVQASLVSNVDLNMGFTALTVKTPTFSTTLSSPTAIEVNYLLKHASINSAYVMSFFEMLNGRGVNLPFTRWSIGMRWYPLGFNGNRLILDQGATAQLWKATAFVGSNLGIANLSLNEMNVTAFEWTPRFGVELPVTATVLAQASFLVHVGTSTGSGELSAQYTGISGMIGLIITPD